MEQRDAVARRTRVAGGALGAGALGSGVLALAAVGLAIVPAGVVLARVVMGWASASGNGSGSAGSGGEGVGWAWRWGLMGSTLAWAGGVAVLATLLAIPAALVIRARGARWMAWIATPLLLPNYLAYSGWGLLRAPRTVMGDWIERAAQAGATELPIVVGRGLAVAGLALWAWPLAAMLLALFWSRVDRGALEALTLDAKGWRRGAALARLGWPGLAAAWALVALVMLGSPVPFHLAQIPTISMEVWRRLMEEGEAWRAWATAAPVALVALAGVAALGRVCVGDVMGDGDAGAAREGASANAGGRWAGGGHVDRGGASSRWVLLGLLVLSVGVPLALFVSSVQEWRSLATVARSLRPAIANSAAVAAIVAGVSFVLAVGAWGAFSSESRGVRRVAGAAALCLVGTAILPGVLVGSALATTIGLIDVGHALGDSSLAVALGHVARFGVLSIAGGWYLARTESTEMRALRRMDGLGGAWGWAVGVLPGQAATLLAVAAAGAALSLHEIEAAIMLTPPGGGGLAHRVLAFLHYSKMEDLSIAAGGMVVVAIGLAGVVGWGVSGRATKREGGKGEE